MRTTERERNDLKQQLSASVASLGSGYQPEPMVFADALRADLEETLVEVARLQTALEKAQRRGDGYKGESETSFARARRAEIALKGAEARDGLRGEALKRGVSAANGWTANDGTMQPVIDWQEDARTAIDISPKDAREKASEDA